LDKDVFKAGIARLFDKPNSLLLGDETANEALECFTRALDRQFAASSGNDILVVAHGTVLSIYVSHDFVVEAMSFWKGLDMPTTIVICGSKVKIMEAGVAAKR